MKITYTTDNAGDYVKGLKAAQTEDAVRAFVAEQRFIANDAYKSINDKSFDWAEFEKGRKLENRGEYAGDGWAAKYGAILMPEILIRVGIVAEQYGAPWGCTYIRLREAGVIKETKTYAKWVDGPTGRAS